MFDEIVNVVPWRDKYLVIYKSGRIVLMEVFETHIGLDAKFQVMPFEIPRRS